MALGFKSAIKACSYSQYHDLITNLRENLIHHSKSPRRAENKYDLCWQGFGSTVAVALLLLLRWKILHNAQMLLTLTSNISAQGQQAAQELRCSAQGESRGFAWAVFPFKHPLRQADQPGPSWTDSTASQSNEEETGSSKEKPQAHNPVCHLAWLETSQICMINHFLQSCICHTLIQISEWRL